MSDFVTAYPYKRIKTSACLWDEMEIVSPEGYNFSNLSEKWDYDVDLQLKISVELSVASLSEEQRLDLEKIQLVVDAHCPSTMWRTHSMVVAEPTSDPGTRVFSAIVDIPGREVISSLDITPSLVGPMNVPFFNKEISRVTLVEGPSKSLRLEASLSYFPTSILSFSEANWVAAPWRFEMTALSLDDLYVNASRLYINSDMKISEFLVSSENNFANSNVVSAVTRDVLMTTLIKITNDRALREECDESVFTPGTVGHVVTKQFQDLFEVPLKTVVKRFENEPLMVLMELDAGCGYFGKGN
ncbi:MAG TPA: hypothetical protein DIT09_14850 [Glutamicibacter sp.]|nr:hypothetical protein [Glutamicibacter sp.]